MAYKKTDEIFVIIPHRGFIPQLKTHGPIPNPIKLTVSIAYDMIVSGIKVFQIDPATKMTVELSVINTYDDNKFTAVPAVSEPAAPIAAEEHTFQGVEVVTPTPVETPVEVEAVPETPVEEADPVVETVEAPVEEVVVEEPVVEVEQTESVDEAAVEEKKESETATPEVHKTTTKKKK